MPQKARIIQYPYLPQKGEIAYVSANNRFMQEAKEWAQEHSLDKAMPNASLIVLDGMVIGRGANGGTYHDKHGCQRVRLNIPTGQGYDRCEGCHPKTHGEPRAIANALKETAATTLQGSELYLWGHWWCCEPCWQAMLDNGINKVYLVKNSDILFNKNATGNIVGRQFAA